AAPQPHSAYLLGHWLSEPVVLDGHTGRVLHVTSTGPAPPGLLGTDLPSFLTLLALYRLLLLSHLPPRSDEYRDARRSVTSWARETDP
ncbi:hypothetical protein NGM37_40355, partial [Streptomyces sp. TRM76130]|nr:hypothetical protein [Streptomyces sp. TRM76130]